MNLELVGALNELEKERGISKDVLFEAIEAAVVSAYKRNHGNTLNVRVDLNERSGQIRVFARKDVVDEVLDEPNEIALAEAKAINPEYELDDIVEIEVTPRNFGRIAAQTAKQVVIQRIREAERALVYEEFSNREGDIVTGIVQRTDYRSVLIDLGKVEAVLPASEQPARESYTTGQRLKVYVTEARKTTKGPQVIVSRSHPGLLTRLFEFEVPEIREGIVEVKGVTREAGNRSKIAVWSKDRNVDPVGACVGPRGMRVQAVVQELRGEKIDIIAWDPMPDQYIANALSPARVVRVVIDASDKSARAIVPDHQLSLAIGKEGQNARLAARLTGWKIDIKSESQMRELVALEALRPKEAPLPGVDSDDKIIAVDDVQPGTADLVITESDADIIIEHDIIQDHSQLELLPEDADFEPPHDVPYEEDHDHEAAVEEIEEPSAPAKPRRRRTERRPEIHELLDEVETTEDEPLPSLFVEDEDELTGIEAPLAPTPKPILDKKPKPRPKKSDDDPKLLRDLAELARLIDTDDEEETEED